MEEIIAKSKAHKAEKAKQREADLDATEALDRELGELLESGALQGFMGRPREQASGSFQKPGSDPVESAFDEDRRDLLQRAKAKARKSLSRR